MQLIELGIPGAYRIEPEKHEDERGFFARAWCLREFASAGIETQFVQASYSFTKKRGSVRGMHYQKPPGAEAKLVRCTKGRVMDVIVDVRPDSPTFLKSTGVELTASNHRAVYIPSGLAHGFQTLDDDVELFYEMTEYYAPEQAGGFRWDDERIDVRWPLEVTLINTRDANYPALEKADFECFRTAVNPSTEK